MNTRNMRVVIVAALVAALLGGGVATARTLISGKDVRNSSLTGADVKNSSLTGSDIKNRSLGIGELSTATQRLIRAKSAGTKGDTGAVGPQGPAGTAGAAGARGATGPVGAAGAAGAKGETGATGPAGATGPQGTFAQSKVTGQTAQLFGFTPWYDTTSDDSLISFSNAGVKIASAGGYAGVNLPIARGTSLSSLKSITYTQTGSAVLGVEIYYRGGLFENGAAGDATRSGVYRGDYTTAYIGAPATGSATLDDAASVTLTGAIKKADGSTVIAAGPTTWGAVKDAIGTGGAGVDATATPDAKKNLNAALILAASIRTSAGSATAAAGEATVSDVKIQLRNLAPVEYTFGN